MTAGRRAETPSPETRLALANARAFQAGRILAVGFDPELARALGASGPMVTEYHTDLRAARATEGAGFGPWLDTGRFDVAVMRMPKEADRLRMLLAMCAPLVEGGGSLVVIGRNDAGARSAGRRLAEVAGDVRVLDARFHCRGFTARVDGRAGPSSLQAWRTRFPASVAGRDLELVSYPGVFSQGKLDDGTRLLLESVEVRPGVRALDVGCGSGAVAAFLSLAGAEMDAVDTDAVALVATAETLTASGASARVFASDLYSDTDRFYRMVVANAPFHEQKRTTSETARRLIAGAPQHLQPGGELWLVANRHLAYGRPLEAAFGTVDVAAEDRRYRVWRAR